MFACEPIFGAFRQCAIVADAYAAVARSPARENAALSGEAVEGP